MVVLSRLTSARLVHSCKMILQCGSRLRLIAKLLFALTEPNLGLCRTHLGAILIGTFFGILAGPTMQLNVTVKDASPDKKDEDAAYLWFNDGASPVRLTLVFALCLGIFFILYQLSVSGSNDFYLLDNLDDFA